MSIDTIIGFEGGYRFLSNFFPSFILHRRDIYPTAEHLFQALKARNLVSRKMIRLASSPGEAKRIGNRIALREDWEDIKRKLMYTVVRLKFQQNKGLKKALLETGNASLVEGNSWHDNYWGDCICRGCKEHKGQNHLGKILMRVREYLRKREKLSL